MTMTPDEQKKQIEMDQAMAAARDILPAMWWAIFNGCKNVGFTPAQAMNLTMCYVASQNAKGIILPGDPAAPPEEDENGD